jgi:hypothetical protein
MLEQTRGGFSQSSSANPKENTNSHHDFQTMGGIIKKSGARSYEFLVSIPEWSQQALQA